MQTGGRVLSGAVTSVFGGVTLLWDIYQLRGGIQELAAGQPPFLPRLPLPTLFILYLEIKIFIFFSSSSVIELLPPNLYQ